MSTWHTDDGVVVLKGLNGAIRTCNHRCHKLEVHSGIDDYKVENKDMNNERKRRRVGYN